MPSTKNSSAETVSTWLWTKKVTSFSLVQTQTYNPEARELDFSCVQVSPTAVFLTKMLDFWKVRRVCVCVCVCVCTPVHTVQGKEQLNN